MSQMSHMSREVCVITGCCRMIGRVLLAFIGLLGFVNIAQAYDAHCFAGGRGSILSLDLGIPWFIETRVIPDTDGVPVPRVGLECKWNITNEVLLDPLVVVLSGFNSDRYISSIRRVRSLDSTAKAPALMYELHMPPTTSRCSAIATKQAIPVQIDTLRVLQLPPGSYLTMTHRLQRKHYNTPGLGIQLIVPGFCSKDVTYYRGHCYTTTLARRSLEQQLAAQSADSGVAQLARFENTRKLKSFVKESQKTSVGSDLLTTKLPLDLAQRHRIGLFYDKRTRSIFQLSNLHGVCDTESFADPAKLRYSVNPTSSNILCGSLRVFYIDVEEPVVEFGDCSEPMPALISFPDAARTSCENCDLLVLSLFNADVANTKVALTANEMDEKAQLIELLPMLITMVLLSVVPIVLCIIYLLIRCN